MELVLSDVLSRRKQLCFAVINSHCHRSVLTYGTGTNRYFRKVAQRLNIETSFVDATDPERVRSALKSNTKVT